MLLLNFDLFVGDFVLLAFFWEEEIVSSLSLGLRAFLFEEPEMLDSFLLLFGGGNSLCKYSIKNQESNLTYKNNRFFWKSKEIKYCLLTCKDHCFDQLVDLQSFGSLQVVRPLPDQNTELIFHVLLSYTACSRDCLSLFEIHQVVGQDSYACQFD